LPINRHDERRQSRAEILVEIAALAGIAKGHGHARAFAVDDKLQRLDLLNRHKNQVGKFILDPVWLKFPEARRPLRGGKKPQPGVQKITLPDRLDDRRVGAFEVHGLDPMSIMECQIFARRRKDSVKSPLFADGKR
jgi:hypothetical protein